MPKPLLFFSFCFPLLPMLAQMCNRTLITFGIAGSASVTSELDDAVAKIADLFLLEQRGEDALDLDGVFEPLAVHSKASTNAHTVGVGYHAALLVEVTKKEIGYFATNAREFEQLFHRVRHDAVVLIYEHSASILGVLRFDVIKPTRADVFFELFNARRGNRLGRWIGGKKLAANEIDACIGALRRKSAHNEQLPRLAAPFQRTKRLGIYFFKSCHAKCGFFFFIHTRFQAQTKRRSLRFHG